MCNSNNLLYSPSKHEYRVYRADGTIVQKGDKLIGKHETWDFDSCLHPRKIFVEALEDPNGPHMWPNRTSQEFYPSVFNLGIYDMTDDEWTFPPSWDKSDIDAKLYEEHESRNTNNLTDSDVWASYDKNIQKLERGEKTIITQERPEAHQTVKTGIPVKMDIWELIDQLYQRVTKCDGTVILTPRGKTDIVDDTDSLDDADIPWVTPGPSESEKADQADRVRRADAWVETGVWEKSDRTETWGEMVEANDADNYTHEDAMRDLHEAEETDIADEDDKAELIRESDEQAELNETDTANDK